MDLLTLIVAVAGIALVTMQGCLCFVPERRRYMIGALDLILALLASAVVAGLRWGDIVLARELGVVMVQGAGGHWIILAVLVGVAALPALAWQQIRVLHDWPQYLAWVLAAGAAVAVWAATQTFMLNPEAPEPLRIWVYDVWWPPLIVWLAICGAGIAVALIAAENPLAWPLLVTALITPLTYMALGIPTAPRLHPGLLTPISFLAGGFDDFADNLPVPWVRAWYQPDIWWLQSQHLWRFCQHAAFLVTVLLFTYSVFRSTQPAPAPVAPDGQPPVPNPPIPNPPQQTRWERFKHWASTHRIPIGAAAFVFLLCLFVIHAAAQPDSGRWARVVEGLPFGLVLLAFCLEAWAQLCGQNGAQPQAATGVRKLLHQTKANISLMGILFVMAVPIIGLGLIDLFSVGLLPRAVDIGALFFFWLLFAEQLAARKAGSYPSDFRAFIHLTALEQVPIWSKNIKDWAKSSVASVKAVVWDGPDNKATIAKRIVAGVVTPVVVLVFFIAVNEVIDYRSIVVQKFEVLGPIDDKSDADYGVDKTDFGQVLSAGLINELGRLREDLRADLTLAEHESSGEHPQNVHLAATAESNVEASFAKSDDVTIGGVKVPIDFFVKPVRHFVDSLLGIRSVQGTVRKIPSPRDSSNQPKPPRFVVLLNSTDGGSWKVADCAGMAADDMGNCPEATPSPDASKTGANAARSGKTGAKNPADPPDKTAAGPSPQYTADASKTPPEDDGSTLSCADDRNLDFVERLVEAMAFDVAQSDPSFLAAGFTQSVDAFKYFRTGLKWWNDASTREEGAQDLKQAIACFELAVQADRDFALAHYRLAVALQRQSRPNAALAEFNASLTANPTFIPGMLGAASLLYDHFYYEHTSAVIPPVSSSSDQIEQARKIWMAVLQRSQQDVSISEQRSAYAELCQAALDDRLPADPAYLSYYYCSRANALYFRLPITSRRAQEENETEARVLDNLGRALVTHKQPVSAWEPVADPWSCGTAPVKPGPPSGSRRIRRLYSAEQYSQHGLQLLPGDDWIRCSVAEDETRLGRTAAMTELDRDSTHHFNLAAIFEQVAESPPVDERQAPMDAAPYFQRTMEEAYEAMSEDPASIEALNLYGDAFWEWKMSWLRRQSQTPPGDNFSSYAEQALREALKLAVGQGNNADIWMVRDTLGEVLMAQNQFRDAAGVLQNPAAQEVEHEARWDLARAQLCVFRQTGNIQAFRDAAAQFAAILKTARSFEFPPYTNARTAWDDLFATPCFGPNPLPSAKPVPPVIFQPTPTVHSAGPVPDWDTVSATVYIDNQLDLDYTLYVAGQGIQYAQAPAGGIILLEPLTSPRQGAYAAWVVGPGGGSYAAEFDAQKDPAHNHVSFVFRGSKVPAPKPSGIPRASP